MKKIIALLSIGAIAFQAPVFADEKSDRIAEIEAQIAELQSELKELKGENSLVASGNIYELSLTEAYEVTELDTSYEKLTPDNGGKFLIVHLDAHNISDQDNYFNWFNFDCYLDGRSISVTDKVMYVSSTYNVITGDIRSGKYLDGYLIFDVPDAWSELEINYKEDYDYQGNVITLTVTPSDILQQ